MSGAGEGENNNSYSSTGSVSDSDGENEDGVIKDSPINRDGNLEDGEVDDEVEKSSIPKEKSKIGVVGKIQRIRIREPKSDDEEGCIDSDEGEDLEDGEVDDEREKSSAEEGEEEEEEEGEDLEDGEVKERRPKGHKMIKTSRIKKEVAEDLEEGEVSDEEERKNKGPIPLCRFFGKGNCTWGTNCRFLHPGVIDKGLYTMFDKRPPPPPTPPQTFPPVKTGLLGHAPPNFPPLPIMKQEPQIIESSWERAQRRAKELIKKSEERKENDIDFEDKKMNLTLTQEEFDKENDYYVKKPSTPERRAPPEEDEGDEWIGSRGRGPVSNKIDPEFVRDRIHHVKPRGGIRQAPPRETIREAPPLHEPEVRLVRESALRRGRFDDRSLSPPPNRYDHRDRMKPDEWHDPWMRSRPKARKDESKRSSYSSASSRSSSSSSRSSNSSKSSKSSTPSFSKKGRGEGETVLRKAPPRRMLSPKPMRIAPPLPSKDNFGNNERRNFGGGQNYDRPTRYAPPAPMPPQRPQGGNMGGVKERLGDKTDGGVKLVRERDLIRGNKRGGEWDSRSSSSRSRSWSRSKSNSPKKNSVKRSKFSRDRSNSKFSSRSSSSSSSSSSRDSLPNARNRIRKQAGQPQRDRDVKSYEKQQLPPVRNIKTEPITVNKSIYDHHNKPRGYGPPKSRVKMTLKPSGFRANKSVVDQLDDENWDEEPESHSISDKDSKEIIARGGVSDESKEKDKRREELLKQLKAVEDAIAKKRSKIT